MNPLDLLFGQIANTVRNHASPHTPGPSYDANPLLGVLGNLFGQHAQQSGNSFDGYRPEADYSQYGGFDPSQLFSDAQDTVSPSSQDSYGNPTDKD